MQWPRVRSLARRVLVAVSIIVGWEILYQLIEHTSEPVYVGTAAVVGGSFTLGAMRRPWFFLIVMALLSVVLPAVHDSSAHDMLGGFTVLGTILGAFAGWIIRGIKGL